MNKTININLAGTFFHIDEDAYLKLQRYLEAIKRSFTDSQGRDEIVADIEARIAELFTEKMEHDKQVIGNKEVEEVITVMGQPEDYLVDEEIFDDQPKSKSSSGKAYKQLFRDTQNKYIGGVCSGLGHYLSMDTIWVRLLFILITIFSGFGIIFYIIFWILVPEAATTAQKLSMKGQQVNITNIEKKIKESIDTVGEKVKNVDYDEIGEKVKKNSKGFFDVIGDIIMFAFKVFAKFIGIILMIVGASALIGLFIGFLSLAITGMVNVPWFHFIDSFIVHGTPIWLISITTFFAVGIPFFFLFYLGLKILVDNLKSIGNVAKFSLLGLWLLSIAGLVAITLIQGSERSYMGSTSKTETLPVNTTDTLMIKTVKTENYSGLFYGNSDIDYIFDENDDKKLYYENVEFNIKHSEDSITRIKIKKDAKGRNYKNAKYMASAIEYGYKAEGNTIKLNDFLTTDYKNKFREQEVDIVLYIPSGTIIKIDDSAYGEIGRYTENDQNYYRSGIINHIWKMGNKGVLQCLDCDNEIDENEEDESSSKIIINGEGVDIDIKDEDDSFKMKINSDSIKIKTT